MTCTIYQIRNLVNDKRYVGSSCAVKCRWRDHRGQLRGNCHPNKKLQRAWNKYKEESFKFERILLCEEKDRQIFEAKAILAFNCFSNGYNILEVNANCTYRQSSETKEKIRQGNLGRIISLSAREAIGKANKNRTLGKQNAQHKKAWLTAKIEKRIGMSLVDYTAEIQKRVKLFSNEDFVLLLKNDKKKLVSILKELLLDFPICPVLLAEVLSLNGRQIERALLYYRAQTPEATWLIN